MKQAILFIFGVILTVGAISNGVDSSGSAQAAGYNLWTIGSGIAGVSMIVYSIYLARKK